MAARGRKPDPDLQRDQWYIASMVACAEGSSQRQRWHAVAVRLGTSVATVRRACERMKGPPTWAGALALDLQENLTGAEYLKAHRAWLRALKARIAKRAKSRGK